MTTSPFIEMGNIFAVENNKRMGQRIELLFLRNDKSDPTRKNEVIKAILTISSKKAKSADPAQGTKFKAKHFAGQANLSIVKSLYQGPPIRKGDRIRALDLPHQPFFTVRAADYRDHVRINIELNE